MSPEFQSVIPELIGPAMIAGIGFWIKSSLNKVEKISDLVIELRHIKEKQTEIKLELERLTKQREEFVLLKSEVKTQWQRLDELRNRVVQREV